MDLVVRRRIGIASWGLGLALAAVWGTCRGLSTEVKGIGWAPAVLVTPLEAGRLKAVNVELHAQVGAAQIVAEIDPEPLVEEKAVAEAQLLAVQATLANDIAGTSRKFAEGLEGSLVQRARIQTQIRSDEALAASLSDRVQREKAVSAAGASAAATAEDLEGELAVVNARLSASRAELSVANQAAEAAQARNAGQPTTNQWDAVAATRLLEQVEGRIKRLSLTAGMDGQVSAVFLRPGDWVTPGIPVLQVSAMSTKEVIGYVEPQKSIDLEAGEFARVVRRNGEVIRGKLQSVGTGPQPTPQQLWADPQRTEWGVPVRIELETGEIGPDEPVTIRI
jgi:multidrug resistance efflux pump